MTDYTAFADLAQRLADAAKPEIMDRFRTGIAVDAKSDASPVTEADRMAEKVMRALINETYPDHGILGEEYGDENLDAEFVWVLDPIDGTNSFVTGKPLFGSLIALCHHGVPVVGVIDAHAANERWVGCKGQPSTHNGAVCTVRACAALDKAWLYTTTPELFEGDNETAFNALAKTVWRRVYGGDCYAYGLLSSGHVDLICEVQLGTYDYAALVPVIEGAGGIITDWSGASLTMDSDGRVLAAGDKALHAKGLKIIKPFA
ncbi:histidinol-phosphatase [Magnetovibrio sp. PR-2]|uniref:histidinol-phosphatase n=1 Tax=Magnetovibrio sp. PR-2 TaxID=3120356 RepID=UPI002FCE5AD5